MWQLKYRNKNTDWIVFYFRNCTAKSAAKAKADMIPLWDEVELNKVPERECRNPYSRKGRNRPKRSFNHDEDED